MFLIKLFLDMLMLIVLIVIIFHLIGIVLEIIHLTFNWFILFPYYSIKMKSWKKGYKYILNL